MPIKTIPLSRLESDLRNTLNECADTGSTLVIQLPDDRLLSIQSLDPAEDDDLINQLLESNQAFRALAERSKSSPRKPFALGPGA